MDTRTDPAGRPVLYVDRSPHRNLIAFAIRVQRVEGGGLHQANHVWRGIDWRQLLMVRGQRVFEFDGFFGLAARSDRDFFGHDLPFPYSVSFLLSVLI